MLRRTSRAKELHDLLGPPASRSWGPRAVGTNVQSLEPQIPTAAGSVLLNSGAYVT